MIKNYIEKKEEKMNYKIEILENFRFTEESLKRSEKLLYKQEGIENFFEYIKWLGKN